MITEFFIGLGLSIARWFVGLFPEWQAPAGFASLDDTVNGFFARFDGVGVWAPWGLLGVCIAVALSVWGIGLVVKLARAIAAHIPFFGGAG